MYTLMVDGDQLVSMQGGTEQIGCMCGGTWWHFCECVRQLTAGEPMAFFSQSWFVK